MNPFGWFVGGVVFGGVIADVDKWTNGAAFWLAASVAVIWGVYLFGKASA